MPYRTKTFLLVALLSATAATNAFASGPVTAPGLPTAPVSVGATEASSAYDGVVQAVRQTSVAAQVPGAVVALEVKAGDAVKAGQVLVRIDSRSAEHAAAASEAQVSAARATQEAAERDFARQKQLVEKHYISQAALDRAEEQYKAATAAAAAQLSTARAVRTESDFYVVRAPYAGLVAEVPIVQGDMAMPGRALLTMYDPTALRVSVQVPQSVAARARIPDGAQIDLGGIVPGRIKPVAAQLLPAVDATTHTQELRLDLPSGLPPLRPGTFARVWLPVAASTGNRLYVPASAIVRRTEVTAVYVVSASGHPSLRQVRVGASAGDRVEVLSGLDAGEQVALEPQVAARLP